MSMSWCTQRIASWQSKIKKMFREPKPGFSEVMELVTRLNPSYPSNTEVELQLKKLYQDHVIAYRKSLKLKDWIGKRKKRTTRGKASTVTAKLNIAMQLVDSSENELQSARRRSGFGRRAISQCQQQSNRPLNNPTHPNSRWYNKAIHPATGKPAPYPKSGWKLAHEHDPENPAKRSFKALDADGRIAWGAMNKRCRE